MLYALTLALLLGFASEAGERTSLLKTILPASLHPANLALAPAGRNMKMHQLTVTIAKNRDNQTSRSSKQFAQSNGDTSQNQPKNDDSFLNALNRFFDRLVLIVLRTKRGPDIADLNKYQLADIGLQPTEDYQSYIRKSQLRLMN